MIPLNQLIPEGLLALGGAFLLGNLAAYIRLRPAWRDAKQARGGQAAKQGARTTTNAGRASPAGGKAGRAGATAAKPGRPGGRASKATGTSAAVSKVNGTSARVSRADATGAAAGKAGGPGSGETGPRRTRPAAEAERGRARSGSVQAAAGPRADSSRRVNARVREPTPSGSKLPSRTRVLVNVLIGLVITVAALATLIRG